MAPSYTIKSAASTFTETSPIATASLTRVTHVLLAMFERMPGSVVVDGGASVTEVIIPAMGSLALDD